MIALHTKTNNQQDVDATEVQLKWLSWCRLCAKRELSKDESSSIFVENLAGNSGLELATLVGKYFWINIKADDEISLCLCLQCKQLLRELVAFTERANKAQTLFCLLQNIKPNSMKQAIELRTQCGLIDEEWQHIIKQQSNADVPTKPILVDRQMQTDELIPLDSGGTHDENSQAEYNETEEIIKILRQPHKNEDSEDQTEADVEHVFEYVVHGENEDEEAESSEYMVSSSNENVRKKLSLPEVIEVVDQFQDDVLQQHKLKIEEDTVNDEKDDENTYNIISDDEDMDYENSSQYLQQDDEAEHSIEMLEDEDEEDEEEFVNISDNPSATKIEALPLLKGKRGRPFGRKNSDVFKFRFDCKECKRTYKNPNIYRRHMSELHSIDVDKMPEFKSNFNTCSICNKQFTTRSSLKIHMRHHLPDEEKFNIPCPYCDRKFSQVGAMRQHVNGIHHQMKPFICDQCGRACKTMAALNEHQLVHTNECPFECEVCHKRFKNKPRLKTHMDIHNKSVYKCLDCGLELNTKRTLLQHRLVHSDVKRFKCEFCDAAFKRSKALKNHLILHSGLRPYKCNFCSKSFSNGSNCRAHKKRTHPRELAEEEATGKEPERVPIPKIEELKSAKSVLVQPRKIKRHAGGLPNQLRKLLKSSEKSGAGESNDYEDTAENNEAIADFHYEIYKSEIEDTDSLVDHPSEECEETVIYEIIDEI